MSLKTTLIEQCDEVIKSSQTNVVKKYGQRLLLYFMAHVSVLSLSFFTLKIHMRGKKRKGEGV